MMLTRQHRNLLVWAVASPFMVWAAIVSAVLLSGCAPYWTHHPELTGFKPIGTATVSAKELAVLCPAYAQSCAILNMEARTCLVIAGPTYDACIAAHEAKHCRGWLHDKREIYRNDCGEDS